MDGIVTGNALRVRGVGDAGERRAQVALDVDGERLERRDVEDAAAFASAAGGSNISRFRHQRNAVSVLPLPVGARISVDSPRAMAGHPSCCGLVGSGKARGEPFRTGGMKEIQRLRLVPRSELYVATV